MKSILLASVASVAFAGVAAAEVSFGGSATLGYNTIEEGNDFYGSAELNVGFEQVLDNGLTFSGGFDLALVTDGLGETLKVSGFNAMVASDTASLAYGEFDNGVAFDAFADIDGMDITMPENDMEMGLVGKASFGGFEFAASLDMATCGGCHPDQLEIGVTGDLGGASVGLGYDYDSGAMGVSASTTLGGADVAFAFASQGGDNSIGLSGSMPFGAVTVGATYAINSNADDAYGLSLDYAAGAISAGFSIDQDSAWEVTFGYAEGAVAVNAFFQDDNDLGIQGSYDMGNGLVMYFGMIQGTNAETYAGVEYDLGGGASVLTSYSDSGVDKWDREYRKGVTVELSFEF